MCQYKVQSGEYDIVVNSSSSKEAADLAIQTHFNQNSKQMLGILTSVIELDRNGVPKSPIKENTKFLDTSTLIENNTSGQYSRQEN